MTLSLLNIQPCLTDNDWLVPVYMWSSICVIGSCLHHNNPNALKNLNNLMKQEYAIFNLIENQKGWLLKYHLLNSNNFLILVLFGREW